MDVAVAVPVRLRDGHCHSDDNPGDYFHLPNHNLGRMHEGHHEIAHRIGHDNRPGPSPTWTGRHGLDGRQ